MVATVCILLAVVGIGYFLYNYLMVQVAQGVQRDIRDQLFSNMQRLPIRYFDTHTHGGPADGNMQKIVAAALDARYRSDSADLGTKSPAPPDTLLFSLGGATAPRR